MSLKTRIIFLTVTVTGTIVVVLFLLQLNNVVESWLNSSLEIAQVAGQQIKHLLIVRLEERAPDAGGQPDPAEAWARTLRDDQNLSTLLEATMAQAHAIIEISIASANETVIASSNPLRPGKSLAQAPELAALQDLSPLRRAARILRGGDDFEFRIPLGLARQNQPVFIIQVLVSSVLLRSGLVPAMWRVAALGAAALLAAMILAYASSSLAVSNLSRLGRAIDRISRGELPEPPQASPLPTPEFAVLESKLNLLGHQVRGEREGATQLRSNVQKLLERLEEALLLFDTEGRMVLCGGAAARILGSSFADRVATARYLGDIFPGNTTLGALADQTFRLRQPLRDAPVEWVRGNSLAHLLLSIEFLPAPGDPRGFTALMRIRDAESHQQLESQLSLSERLDAMNRITSSVAHEIKNPLNSIAARLDYLQSWASSESPEAEEEIQTIFQEVNRLDRVVRTFLDFTRPVELAREDIDIVALTGDIAELLKPDAARRQVSVRFTTSERELFVHGDEDLLKEAILNVATNGIEAMPQGGQLDISLTHQNQHCTIAIADTGIGIPETQRDKIFELYFTTKENGSGLGLAMTYRAIQLHGGSIELASEPGKGSTFSLNLPIIEGRDPG